MERFTIINRIKVLFRKSNLKAPTGIFILCFLMISLFQVNAQEIMQVPTGSNLSEVIHGDTTATGEWIDRIYELERDGYYEVTERLNKVGAKLHLRGAEGEGFLPAIFPIPDASGSYPSVIRHAGDMTLDNVYISNNNGPIDEWGGIRVTAARARVEVINSHIENERGGAIFSIGDSMSVFIRDSRISKIGGRQEPGGNGRVFDTRSRYVDTLVLQNVTFYLVQDRMLRTQGGVINYLKWDHTTGYAHQGRHGALQLGQVNTAIITNNLFIDCQWQGDHDGLEEQLQPENENIYMITLDTILDGTQLEIRNNNYAWSQRILDFWDSQPTTSKPAILTETIKGLLGEEAVEDAYFEELVEFTNVDELPPLEYMEALFADPMPDPMPLWMEADDIGIAFVDFSYAETYDSYTAADRGFPVGDLNHFPELKSLWEAGGVVGIEEIRSSSKSLTLFPNPATDFVRLSKKVDELFIYNVTGSMVKHLRNTESINVSEWPEGIYILRAKTGTDVMTQKLIVK